MLLKRYLLFILILFLGFTKLKAQEKAKVDSLTQVLKMNLTNKERVNTYNTIAEEYRYADSLKVAEYTQKAIQLAEKINYPEGIVDAYFWQATTMAVIASNYTGSIRLLDTALQIAKNHNYLKGQGYIQFLLGANYSDQGYLKKALEADLEAARIFEKINHLKGLGMTYSELARFYDMKKDTLSIFKYSKKAFEINKKINNKSYLLNDYYYMGLYHQHHKNYSKALVYYQKMKELSKEISPPHFAYAHIPISLIYISEKKYNKADSCLEQGAKYCEENNLKWVLSDIYYNIGLSKFKQKQYHQSVKAFQKSIQLAQEAQSAQILELALKAISKSYESIGNYALAYENYIWYTEFKDSLYNIENAQELAWLEANYQHEKATDSLQFAQEKERLFFKQETQRQKATQRITFVGLGLVSILLGISVYFFLGKQKNNRRLKATNENLHQANEEIKQQKEEILQQNQYLEDTLKKLQNTQNQLVQSEKMASIGMLTASVAHEINNPINYISGGVQALEALFEEVDEMLGEYEKLAQISPEELEQFKQELYNLKEDLEFDENKSSRINILNDIQTGVTRIAHVVKSLRVFTRLDENALKKADIHENLDAVLVVLGNRFMGKIELVKKFAPTLSPVWCFPAQINQVVLNLLINAEEALEGSGKITLKTSENEEFIIVSVHDNGKGIPSKIQDSIFKPFFTTKSSAKKTGLGLVTVKEIIQEHQGKIEFISEEGKGSKFLIYLPKNI